MKTDVELLIQPYSAREGRSLLQTLVLELDTGRWTVFRAAVAFARASGSFPDLLGAILAFAHGGGQADLTFGADAFSGEDRGSDYDAIKGLLAALGDEPTVRLFLYHEQGRTFHPKLYMFANEEDGRAMLIVGSSNWSRGGFWNNVEVNVIIHLDLADENHSACFGQVQKCFDAYWVEQENGR